MISRAIDSWVVAFLGFLLLPWTTLAYVVFYDVGSGRQVTGIEWFLVGLAFVVDIGSYVGSRSARAEALRGHFAGRRRARHGRRRRGAARLRRRDVR